MKSTLSSSSESLSRRRNNVMSEKKTKEISKLIKIGLSEDNAQEWINYVKEMKRAGQEPSFTSKALYQFWQGKYNFCKSKLGLNEGKSIEWANRAIRAIVDTILELRDFKIEK